MLCFWEFLYWNLEFLLLQLSSFHLHNLQWRKGVFWLVFLLYYHNFDSLVRPFSLQNVSEHHPSVDDKMLRLLIFSWIMGVSRTKNQIFIFSLSPQHWVYKLIYSLLCLKKNKQKQHFCLFVLSSLNQWQTRCWY